MSEPPRKLPTPYDPHPEDAGEPGLNPLIQGLAWMLAGKVIAKAKKANGAKR